MVRSVDEPKAKCWKGSEHVHQESVACTKIGLVELYLISMVFNAIRFIRSLSTILLNVRARASGISRCYITQVLNSVGELHEF